MSLTNPQKFKILQLLGLEAKMIQPGSVVYNKILNDRLNNIPEDATPIVTDYLAQIKVIEDQMTSVPTRIQAEKIEDITVNLKELEQLRSERKKIAREMARFLDLPYQGGDMSRVV